VSPAMSTVSTSRPGDGIAQITLSRPEAMNAISSAMAAELARTCVELAAAPEVRVVVLGAAGERAFSAGADLKERAGMTDADIMHQRHAIRGVFGALLALPQPVIAAVHGFALGGGCELALACDMIVASDTARFGQPEITLGIIPGGGGTQRLARVIGKQRAMEYVLTGRQFDADMALEMGLINKVAKRKSWLEEAMELARTVAERPPIATRLAKQAVLAAEETALAAGLENERRLYELAMATEDRVEGMQAFLEKREPRFEGR
jgi:enoyl-CoA hydratase/carnithine racemase